MIIVIAAAAGLGYMLLKKKAFAPTPTTTSVTLMASEQSVTVKSGGTIGVFPPSKGAVLTCVGPGSLINIVQNRQVIITPKGGPGQVTYTIGWHAPDGTPQMTHLNATVA